jgi:hypothetical protein
MKSIIETALDAVVGALRIERGDAGVTLHRTPADIDQVWDPAMAFIGTVPSGVSLDLLTDADVIEVELGVTVLRVAGMTPSPPPCIDIVADGILVASTQITDVTEMHVNMATLELRFVEGGPAVVRVELPPSTGARRVQVWLPNSASTMLRDVRVPAAATASPAPADRPRWVHHGSSISHCAEAPSPTRTWPALVAAKAGYALTNLGLAGQCQLDQSLARAIATTPADLISLKLGINIVNADSMRERAFVPAVHAFLDTVRAGHPDTPLLVISPIFCPIVEDVPGPTLSDGAGKFVAIARPDNLNVGALTLRRIREILEMIVAVRQGKGDTNLHFLQGTELFGAADVHLMPDDLHPDGEGYALMADRFHDKVVVNGPF